MKLTVNSNFPFRISAVNYASDGNVTLTIESESTTTESQYRYEADFGMQQAEEHVPISLAQYTSDFTESHAVKEKTKISYRLMLKHLRDYGDIDLPAINGDASRYDLMAFSTTLDENTEYNGPLGNIKGDDPESLSANTYSVLVSALSSVSGTINGIQTGSYLVTP